MEMKLAVCVTTMNRPGWKECVDSWDVNPVHVYDNSITCIGPVPAMQRLYEECADADVIAYFHDDLTIYEKDWQARVLKEFADPQVGVVGFGGSLWHGSPDIYKVPYHISQLGRTYYLSNVNDWEVHGGRFAGERDIATVDGFCLIVRRQLLDRVGGWQPELWPPHHVYDHRITLCAYRHKYKVRLVGISCSHGGGQTITTAPHINWAATTKWGSDEAMHTQGHRLLYDEFRDVLPVILEA